MRRSGTLVSSLTSSLIFSHKTHTLSYSLHLQLSPTTAGRGGTSIENMKKLNKDLMKDYNRNIRPVKNQEKAIVVRFGVAVVEVADLQPESGRVTIAAWLRMVTLFFWIKSVKLSVYFCYILYKQYIS